MVIKPCNDCGGKLIKNANIYTCSNCGKVFHPTEVEKSNLIEALEVTDCSVPGVENLNQMYSKFDMSSIWGCSKVNLAVGHTVELENGEKMVIQGFFIIVQGAFFKASRIKQVKTIEAGTEVLVTFQGKQAEDLSIGTILYKESN